MEDEITYVLYDIQFVDKELESIDSESILDILRDHLKTKSRLNILNIIYPTFDGGLFITTNKSEEVYLESVIKVRQDFVLKKVRNEFPTLYIEPKSSDYPNIESKLRFMRKFAVRFMSVNTHDRPSKTLELVRCNTYQYKLIQESLGNNFFRTKSEIKENDYKKEVKMNEEIENNENNFAISIVQDNDYQFRYKYENENLEIDIYKGDLIEAPADAIVNAANRNLVLGGGVAESIRNQCGYQVQDACKRYLKDNRIDRIEDGDVMHTKSYNMKNCDYIIHAVGPNMTYYEHDRRKCYTILKRTFYNVFKHADMELKVESIAVPLISSGIFGVPKDVCIKQLYMGIEQFLRESKKETRNLKYIRIPSIESQANSELIKIFKSRYAKSVENKNLIEKTINIKREMIVESDDVKNNSNHIIQKQTSLVDDDAFEDICVICEKKKKIVTKCENGKCMYCKTCVSNYTDNDNKCNCN